MAQLLYYVHDPMCSWCWAFRPVLQRLRSGLPQQVEFRALLGGLAPDTDDPMPESMQRYLQQTWRRIGQQVPGTEFNFEFWKSCLPRRNTHLACRAVIAARLQDPRSENPMILAIQQAYFLQALNPSDKSTLVDLARMLALDTVEFSRKMDAPETQAILLAEVGEARAMGVDSFPSLVLDRDGSRWRIPINYNDDSEMAELIARIAG